MTSAAGAIIDDKTAPTIMATTATPTPSRRCTRSRSTNAIPIMVTPEGAIRPGATGMRQGPFGTHSVPAWPISQFAAGIVRPNRTRHTTPSTMRRLSLVCSLGCIIVIALSSRVILLPSIAQIHRPAAGRPGSSRSHSPSRGAASGRPDSRCGCPPPGDRRNLGRPSHARAQTSPPCR